MQRTLYKLKKIEVIEFRPKDSISILKIIYSKNDEQQQIVKEFPFVNPVEIVNKILLDIKNKDKVIVDEGDDILQNIYITRIDNEEEVEDKMLYFFQNLFSKYSKIKSLKKAQDYMRLYDEIKTTKLIL